MVTISNAPLIKWSGSKRYQAKAIVDFFPKKINTYYECFLGGGSVLHELLNRIAKGKIQCEKIICCDINKDLIDIFNIFLKNRKSLFDYYCTQRAELVKRAEFDEEHEKIFTREHVKKCQTLYYENRDKYNNMDKDDPERPYLFYWLSRTCFNGLIRFNPQGKFNASFHVGGRLGIKPSELQDTFDSWSYVMNNMNGRIEFINDSFHNVVKNAQSGDVVYMDPPYENTTGLYFSGSFDTGLLYETIRKIENQGAQVLLSYDGFTGNDDRTANVPKDIYKYHTYVKSGRSSFKLLKSNSAGQSKTDDVSDSLYISYIPQIKEKKKLF
ncbi:Dam family site-specific DNA-(adenine-N6)-methyltransferase [uncultured Methanobrevibacter sp.]|uniref:DNA adenine methylase n=1 Tax=uncultured Methanobrevibacter sp. TaxID=253161 RepID=UPI0025D03955|nr:Dam family site-specific DNA-(adenine-N6)-methyltransferase [uncultured Methanobrevibacter sp.]